MIWWAAIIAGANLLVGGADMNSNATWNVMDFGAIPDGTSDNTAAFQKALDAAGAANGGVVSVPTGRYRFDGSLTIPKEVALRGIYAYAPAHAGIRDNSPEKPVYGTVLMPCANAGAPDGPPFILLQSNSVLQGVCIFYPDQKPDAAPPTAYPYTVAMRGNNPAIMDCELLNSFNAIDASRNQRALIRNIHGQPLHIGVFIDLIYDIGRLENVHWNPWWSMQKDLFEWQKANGIAFIFGKTDWHYVLNTFCFGYNIGYQFIDTKAGATNGNFLGIGADDCRTSVVIEQSAPMGILITNGEFVSIDGPDPTMVRVADTNTGTVRFVNCAFWGPANRNAVIGGNGTIGFSDCTFVNWACHDKPCYSIEATGGSILVRGCEFKENKPQISIGPGVKRAIVTDNLLMGEKRIANKAKGRAIIDNNAVWDLSEKAVAKKTVCTRKTPRNAS
mgnify:CR=1 FL=1